MHRRSIAAALVLTTTLFAASSALAAELPARKAGLWEMKMTFEGRNLPPQTMQHCVDAKTDKLMNSQIGSGSEEACSKRDMQVSGNTITVDSVCKFGETASTSRAVITGSFDQAYTVKITSTREGSPPSNIAMEAKWLGPCKADQKPGDVVMGNGRKTNVLETSGRRPSQPAR